MNIRLWYLIHKWTSLVCTIFLLMLCITGLPLIFHEEIDHLMGEVEAPEMAALRPTPASTAWLKRHTASAPAISSASCSGMRKSIPT